VEKQSFWSTLEVIHTSRLVIHNMSTLKSLAITACKLIHTYVNKTTVDIVFAGMHVDFYKKV